MRPTRGAVGSWSLVAGALLAMGLSGCSQVSALAPVSGDAITSLRIAADDVLLENGVTVLIAPKCKTADPGFACAGKTVDGKPISVTSGDSKATTITVTVGGALLYHGTVEAVIQKAAEARS